MHENKIEVRKFKDLFQASLPSFINSLTNTFYSSIIIIPTITSETYNHKDIKAIKGGLPHRYQAKNL